MQCSTYDHHDNLLITITLNLPACRLKTQSIVLSCIKSIQHNSTVYSWLIVPDQNRCTVFMINTSSFSLHEWMALLKDWKLQFKVIVIMISLGRTHELSLCRHTSRIQRISEIGQNEKSKCFIQLRLIKHELVHRNIIMHCDTLMCTYRNVIIPLWHHSGYP